MHKIFDLWKFSENAYALMADLERRLVRPPQGDHEYLKPQISTDGFPAYPAAVAMNFGDTATHGILIKEYVNPESGRYAPPKLKGTQRINANGISNPRTICTSHIERCNLSIRTFIRRFTRLSLGFSKKVENLSAAVAAHLAFYNFCRIHGTLRCTPAMAAHVTGKLWSLTDLFEAVNDQETRRNKAAKVQRLLERMRIVLG